ncbi:MAG: TerB family tellurite resistance protein [Synergistaceae bacterium]|nr:TerB family tellurite resistance protein [Synergistaceae bacterium]
MQPTWISGGNTTVSLNEYTAADTEGPYIDVTVGYQRTGEEKVSNEKRPSVNMTLLTISKLCGQLGLSVPAAGGLSLSEKQDISIAAQMSGSLIVPDIAREPAVSAGDVITVVPIHQGDALTPLYAKKHLLVELGMAIARSDGYVDDYELVQLSYTMEKHFSFTALEIRALTALKDFCLLYPPDFQDTARLLVPLMPMWERLEASRMMTTVAAAGGQLARMEFDALGILFDIMELGDDAFNQVIDELCLKRVWVLLKGR